MISKRRFLPLLGIALSLIILAIIASLLDFNFSFLLTIKPAYFLLAVISSLMILFLQGLRFKFIIDTFAKNGRYNTLETVVVRMGSQFIAMTTPAYVGGELARAAWLTSKGVPAGKALWLPYIEIIFDVYSTGIFSLASGLLALIENKYLLGGLLTLLSTVMLVLITSIIFVSRREQTKIPQFLYKIAENLLGDRGVKIMNKGELMLQELKEAARGTINTRNAKQLLTLTVLTAILAILTGSTLYLISLGLSVKLDFFQSLLIVFASVILGNLPVTFGGAGLSEAGVYYYCSIVFGISSWSLVFAWRLASYIIPLIVSGLSGSYALNKFAVSKTD